MLNGRIMYFKYIKIRLCFMLFCLVPIICNGIDIKLEGLNTELYCNVYKKLSNTNIDIKYIDENVKKQLIDIIKEGLRPLGYYSPCINFFFIQID